MTSSVLALLAKAHLANFKRLYLTFHIRQEEDLGFLPAFLCIICNWYAIYYLGNQPLIFIFPKKSFTPSHHPITNYKTERYV